MDGGGGEPAEGKEDLGTVDDNLGKGGGEPKGVGYVFQGSGSGGTYFTVVDGVMTPHMGWDLGEFQHRVTRRIIGRKIWRLLDGI